VIVEGFGGCLPAEGFAWSSIDGGSDGIKVTAGVFAEVGAFGEILAQQPVGVFVRAALPGAVRVTEVDGQTSVDTQLGVLSLNWPL